MGFFSLFRSKRKVVPRQRSMYPDSQATALLWSMRTDIDQLRGRLHTIDIALEKHDDQLIRHDTQLKGHEQKIQTLEQKITETPAQAVTPRRPVRSDIKDAPTSTQCTPTAPPQQFDIDQFTEQEKRILAVFFQNKGVNMSYADVATALNKSACTVKNQMNQIRQKADLFHCTIGNQSRNLFTLKGDLRIEKYLKFGQPIERPLSIPEPDQSDYEEVSVPHGPARESQP